MKRGSDRKKAAGRRSSISQARTYAEIGAFWDEHDLSDYWDSTRPVGPGQMESEESLYAVEKDLSDTIRREAKERGVSPHTLVNLWLQEKVQKLKPRPRHG
jgi:hypothetical protein